MRRISGLKSSHTRLFAALMLVLLLLAMNAGTTLAAKDKTAPTGSIAINNGARYTNNRQVTLYLMASDNSGKAVDMALSHDGRAWTRWEKVVNRKAWLLRDGDGIKTVFVIFRDNSKNTSKPYSASIILDRVAPQVQDIRIETTPTQARITWRTNEPAFCSATFRRSGAVMRSMGRTAWTPDTSYQLEHEAVITDLRPNDTYTVTIQATDQAGNIGQSAETSFVARLSDQTPPTGSVAINGGANYANNAEVTLNLEGYDDAPGRIYYSLSQDGLNWEGWLPLESQRRYILAAGEGRRQVYARFRDEAGNISQVYSDHIILDTTAPEIYGFSVVMIDRDSLRLSWQTTEPAYCTTQFGMQRTMLQQPLAGKSGLYETSHQVTINGLQAGSSYTFIIRAQDEAGNHALAFEQVFALPGRDNTPPTGSVLINNGARFTGSRDVTLSLSATDAETVVTQMQFSNDGWSWSPWEAYAATRAWVLTPGDGVKTVYVRFRDRAGNVSSAVTATIEIDVRNPEIYDLRVDTVGINTVNISWRTNEPTRCSVEYYFQSPAMTRRVDATPAGRFATEHEVRIVAVLPSTEYRLIIEAVDEAGNRARYEDTFRLRQRDTTPPRGRLIINDGNGYTNNRQVQIRVEADDDQSRRERIEFQLSSDGYRWGNWTPSTSSVPWTLTAGDGPKTVYFRLRDEAGNTSAAMRETITVDTRGPRISDVNVEILERGSVRINWRTDEPTQCVLVVGVNRTQSRGSNYETDHSATVSGLLPGSYRFVIEAADRAGNHTSFSGDFRSVQGDTMPPSGSLRINNGANYTNMTQVTVQVSARDDQSGQVEYQLSNDGRAWSNWTAASQILPWNLTPGDGAKTVYARFRDGAGNVSPAVSDQITLDTRAPRIFDVSVVNVSPTDVRINWRTDEPTQCVVVVGANRTQSRGSNYETDHSVTVSGLAPGSYRFVIEAADRAGNRNSFSGDFKSVQGDTTPPSGSLRINNGAKYTNKTQVTVQVSARDDQPGQIEYQLSNDGRAWGNWTVASQSLPWNLTPGDGAKTVYARFRDGAGNVSQAVSDQIVLDTRAPRIFDVSVVNVSPTGVRISWRTDEPTFGVVVFSGVRSMQQPPSQRGDYSTQHSTELSGLNPGTTYRFTINAHDQADNNASYDGSFQTAAGDTSAPSGRIRFAGNAQSTSDRKVRVELSADDNSGRVEYQLSNDGRTWSAWSKLVPSVEWTLTAGEGVKTVYARFRDAAGNVSEPVSAQITLTAQVSTKPPSISNVTVEVINENTVKIRWKTNVPTLGEVRFWFRLAAGDQDSPPEVVKEPGNNYSTEHELTISGLQPRRTYRFEIIVRDQNGNVTNAPASSFQTK